ncbi:MAG: hypothetical protein Q7U75_12495, partial [Desulfobacterales bacterium]|nr:hypothetical protein [Desulfobacterales bacterium]
ALAAEIKGRRATRVINDNPGDGGHLYWLGVQPMIDARLDLYVQPQKDGSSILLDLVSATSSPDGMDRIVRKYGIDYVIYSDWPAPIRQQLRQESLSHGYRLVWSSEHYDLFAVGGEQ